jgi:YVTN family beta-propeller protein
VFHFCAKIGQGPGAPDNLRSDFLGNPSRPMTTHHKLASALALLVCIASASGVYRVAANYKMGKQADGGYIVSTGQKIQAPTIKFKGRPSDIALHPNGDLYAVLSHTEVFLGNKNGLISGSSIPLGAEAAFRGIVWTPDGKRLLAGTASGYIASFSWDGKSLSAGPKIEIGDGTRNPVPGGMAVTGDGSKLYVTAADLRQAVEVDLRSNTVLRRFPVENVAFGCKLSSDEKTLLVSNWGGRLARPGDDTSKSEDADIVVDKRGVPDTGTVSLIDLSRSPSVVNVPVGIHPSDICVVGNHAYVANTLSDTISDLDVANKRVARTIPIRYGRLNVLGAMPDAMAVHKNTLYCCDGGDNALAEVDLRSGKVEGFHPVGYYPIALFLRSGAAVVLNSKGNGSVANTAYGRIGNAHDFEGSISVVDLSSDLKQDTAQVAINNKWGDRFSTPNLAVYHGAIKHVIYIIKENRTYDEIFGDMPEGDGDRKLADIGNRLAPNHQALAREFGLFDNAYVSGTNSNDGHAWSTQALANDYQEHFYVGYSRTYNDDGNCSMSLSTGGGLWDQATKKHVSFRDYGEFVVADDAEFQPRKPKDWFEAWADYKSGEHKFTYIPHCRVAGLKPYVHPTVHYWPLIQSDQARATEFIKDYSTRLANGTLPTLTIMSLPCDHTEGTNPDYPKPEAMIADNDLALGRVVEAVSKSSAWSSTCIFVIEDDAQSGPDHVDGHRTSFMVISPYNRRHEVNHTFYTTTNMVRSVEMMAGLDPMNRFDYLSEPITTCFTNAADLTPYTAVPANVPLDEPNPGRVSKMTGEDRYWAMKTKSLNWSHPDAPDSYWLNRVIWASLHSDHTPYPARAGEEPGEVAKDGDDD